MTSYRAITNPYPLPFHYDANNTFTFKLRLGVDVYSFLCPLHAG